MIHSPLTTLNSLHKVYLLLITKIIFLVILSSDTKSYCIKYYMNQMSGFLFKQESCFSSDEMSTSVFHTLSNFPYCLRKGLNKHINHVLNSKIWKFIRHLKEYATHWQYFVFTLIFIKWLKESLYHKSLTK